MSNQNDYYVPWDVAQDRALDEAEKHAGTHYDLSQPEGRLRCWLAHVAESYGGGFGNWCSVLNFDRDNMDGYLYRGDPLNERNQREMVNHKDELNSLAAHDPFYAQMNLAGQQNGK